MNSFTQAVYHIGRLWTKLKDAVFITIFIWGSCWGPWYITSKRVELIHALLGNPNPRLHEKSKPARTSEANITGLLRTIHTLCFSLCIKLLSHLDWESAPVWLSGAWLWEINQELKPSWAADRLNMVTRKKKKRPFSQATENHHSHDEASTPCLGCKTPGQWRLPEPFPSVHPGPAGSSCASTCSTAK